MEGACVENWDTISLRKRLLPAPSRRRAWRPPQAGTLRGVGRGDNWLGPRLRAEAEGSPWSSLFREEASGM